MPEELNLPTPYKVFKHSDSSEPYYQFETSDKRVYFVYFSACDEYFAEFEECHGNVFMLNFDIHKEVAKKRVYDVNIELTITGIVRSFFEVKENVLLFVCESSDKRHRQRKIVFNQWYRKNREEVDIIKYSHDSPYYISLLAKKDNVLLNALKEFFFNEVETYAAIPK